MSLSWRLEVLLGMAWRGGRRESWLLDVLLAFSRTLFPTVVAGLELGI